VALAPAEDCTTAAILTFEVLIFAMGPGLPLAAVTYMQFMARGHMLANHLIQQGMARYSARHGKMMC
jgi:hypothetical protein